MNAVFVLQPTSDELAMFHSAAAENFGFIDCTRNQPLLP
jgi:hypothetical protein